MLTRVPNYKDGGKVTDYKTGNNQQAGSGWYDVLAKNKKIDWKPTPPQSSSAVTISPGQLKTFEELTPVERFGYYMQRAKKAKDIERMESNIYGTLSLAKWAPPPVRYISYISDAVQTIQSGKEMNDRINARKKAYNGVIGTTPVSFMANSTGIIGEIISKFPIIGGMMFDVQGAGSAYSMASQAMDVVITNAGMNDESIEIKEWVDSGMYDLYGDYNGADYRKLRAEWLARQSTDKKE